MADYAALKAEVSKPAYGGQADADVVATLNAPTTPALARGRFLTERGILDLLGISAGDTALSALEAAQSGNSILERAVRLLRADGIDFGNPQTQAMLDQLQAGKVLTAEVVAALKGYGQVPGPSIAQSLGFPMGVTVEDIKATRRAP